MSYLQPNISVSNTFYPHHRLKDQVRMTPSIIYQKTKKERCHISPSTEAATPTFSRLDVFIPKLRVWKRLRTAHLYFKYERIMAVVVSDFCSERATCD